MTIYQDNAHNLRIKKFRWSNGLGPIEDAELIVSVGDTTVTGNVTGATNATPIVITSAAHGLSTGDTVLIDKVVGNKAANGAHVVTVINSNSFSLDASVGNGAYQTGGEWFKAVAGLIEEPLVAISDEIYEAIAGQEINFVEGREYIFIVDATNYGYHAVLRDTCSQREVELA